MNKIKKLLFALAALTIPTSLFGAGASNNNWPATYSKHGRCKVSFPHKPEHMQQMMPVPEQNRHLQYNVYVAGNQEDAVYMMLIAEYPMQVNSPDHAQMNLENFLNGVMSQNPNNKLIFADIVDFQGEKALDFFIRTKGVFFKGRAIIANNNLYLIAMECDMQNYNEDTYNYFVESFQFTN